MNNSLNAFQSSINDANNLLDIHSYISKHVRVPVDYDDILRFNVVFCMSALDKLIHDLVRIGMVEIFIEKRAATPKFHGEGITIKTHQMMMAASIPPAEVIFEQEVARKLSYLSFQDPDKISSALSFIWDDKNKIKAISQKINISESQFRTKLKLVSQRRNAIVHEADINPATGTKNSISLVECKEISDFIKAVGIAVYDLVRLPIKGP